MSILIWTLGAFLLSESPDTNMRVEPRVYKMKEIVVTAERATDPRFSTSRVYVIKGDSLPIIAYNLGDALKFTPGLLVDVNPIKNETRLQIRGFSSQNNLILIDGVPTGSSWDNATLLSEISISNVRRIDVINGSNSILYGPNSMGGVVNVITKNPPEGLSFETRMEIGSWHTKSSLLKIGGYGFLISGLIEKSDGYRFNTDYDGEDINIKYGHKFFDRHRVKLNLGYHKAMKGSFGRKPGEPWRFPWWERARLDLIYSFSSLFEIRYYRNLWDNLLVCYKDTTLMNERWRSHHHNQNNGIEGIFNGRIQKNNIAIGLNLKEDKMETTNEGKADERIKGGFIQWVYRPVDRINLSIGSRYDNHSSSGEKFNYNIGLSYIPMENLCFRTNYGTAMRFPALRETHGDTTTPANPNLVPEESENFEIGVDLSKVQITYFNSRARNLIQKDTSGKFENIENARMRGVEASVNFEIGKWSRCFFNYTRLDAINQKTGKLLESSPRNKLSCGYIIKPQEGIKLALSINYTGSMEKNEQTLSPYTLLSGNISYHIFGGELYLGVNNLLNERHKLENGIEAPGREWRAGIDVGR